MSSALREDGWTAGVVSEAVVRRCAEAVSSTVEVGEEWEEEM
jgi:hypothetical protein